MFRLEYRRADRLFNVGFLPRTVLDDKKNISAGLNESYPGNGKHIDVIEIGRRLGTIGEVRRVKVLGSMLLIEGDTAIWKVNNDKINDKHKYQI